MSQGLSVRIVMQNIRSYTGIKKRLKFHRESVSLFLQIKYVYWTEIFVLETCGDLEIYSVEVVVGW